MIKFEEEHVIPLDWEVRDFLRSARDLENSEGPVGLGDRISHDFEALVLLCKSRAEKLAKNRSKPPSIQLGKSSQQSIGKCTSIASEILDDKLELVKLQADAKAAKAEAEAAKAKAEAEAEAAKAKAEAEAEAEAANARAEAEIIKKQAQIRAKRLKQSVGTGSHRSGSSSRSSSRKSERKSLFPSLIEDTDRRLTIGSLEWGLKNSFSKARRPGSPVGAAVTLKPQTAAKTVTTYSGLFSGVAEVSRFEKVDRYRDAKPSLKHQGYDTKIAPVEKASAPHLTDPFVEPKYKPKIDQALKQEMEDRNVSCPPGFEGINPAPCTHFPEVGTGISSTRDNAFIESDHMRPQVIRHNEQARALDGSRKDFLDEAVLIGYDGTNMPYVMFYNQIMNLMVRCSYPDRKLPILRAACVRSAAQTIAVVISDTPGFNDNTKIAMGLSRLEQRFGRSGGFANEPEVQQIRNGPKLSSTSDAAWKIFKDELTQCYVFAHSYKKPAVLEGRLVVDLAHRLPSYAKQRYMDYLKDRFGSTNEPTFASLMAFVEREEECKSSDFAVQLMADEKSERAGAKSSVGNGSRSSSYPSMKVKKTSAQFDGMLTRLREHRSSLCLAIKLMLRRWFHRNVLFVT